MTFQLKSLKLPPNYFPTLQPIENLQENLSILEISSRTVYLLYSFFKEISLKLPGLCFHQILV